MAEGRRERQEVDAELATVEYGLQTISVFDRRWEKLARRRAELLIELSHIDNPPERQKYTIDFIYTNKLNGLL